MQVWGSDAALERNDTERGEVWGQFLISSWSHSTHFKWGQILSPATPWQPHVLYVSCSGSIWDRIRPSTPPSLLAGAHFLHSRESSGPQLVGNWKFPWSYSRESAGYPSLNMFYAEEQHISLESMQGETAARRWFIGNAKSSAAERLSCFVACRCVFMHYRKGLTDVHYYAQQ